VPRFTFGSQGGHTVCNQGGHQLDQDAQKFFKSLGLSGNQAPTSDQIQQFANETAIPHIQVADNLAKDYGLDECAN
jgi:hypothetical protein